MPFRVITLSNQLSLIGYVHEILHLVNTSMYSILYEGEFYIKILITNLTLAEWKQ